MKEIGAYFGSKEGIDYAYSDEIQAKLANELDMLPTYYPKEYVLAPDTDRSALKNVNYIFSTWGMAELSEEQVREWLPNLKAIFYAAGTVQYFARPFMHNGVQIISAWGANAVPVAETTISEIILANKGFFQTMHVTGDTWVEHDFGKPYPGTFDNEVGIIGAGMIGKMVIQLLKNFRVKVLVFDPFLSDEKAAELGVEKVEQLPELFRRCNVISNHLANNPQTVGMIDKKCFSQMGERAVFINTGRGAQVVEADLIAAMKEKPTRAAVLDVTWPEPPAAGSELYTLKNVILTPHMAGSIGYEVHRMGEYIYDEFESFIAGKPLKYGVTEKMLETMA